MLFYHFLKTVHSTDYFNTNYFEWVRIKVLLKKKTPVIFIALQRQVFIPKGRRLCPLRMVVIALDTSFPLGNLVKRVSFNCKNRLLKQINNFLLN